MITVVVHILNQDPFIADMVDLPEPSTSIILVQNPRLRDGKALSNLNQATEKLIYPIHRINFIEVLHIEDEDDIISHVRD
jgi:hypothetical protein